MTLDESPPRGPASSTRSTSSRIVGCNSSIEFGGGSAASDQTAAVLTKEQMNKLYEVVEFDPKTAGKADPRKPVVAPDHKTMQLHLNLPLGSLELSTAGGARFFSIAFSTLNVDLVQYPESMNVNVSLDSFDAVNQMDHSSFISYHDSAEAAAAGGSGAGVLSLRARPTDVVPTPLFASAAASAASSSSSSSSSSSTPLLLAEFTTNPRDSLIRASSRLRLALEPLRVTFDRRLVDSLRPISTGVGSSGSIFPWPLPASH